MSEEVSVNFAYRRHSTYNFAREGIVWSNFGLRIHWHWNKACAETISLSLKWIYLKILILWNMIVQFSRDFFKYN